MIEVLAFITSLGPWAYPLASGLASYAAIAWVAKPVVKRIDKLSEDFDEHCREDHLYQVKSDDRLARIETKIDFLVESEKHK